MVRGNNYRLIFTLFLTLLFFSHPTLAADTTNGLFCVSHAATGLAVTLSDGSTIHLGAPAPMQILKATIYSENNANTDFLVFLDTTDFPVDPKTGSMPETVVLRIGDRAYSCSGSGGKTGLYNDMQFNIPNRDEAEAAARGLSTNCFLRQPPGYKYLTEFTPNKSEFTSNEPVLVTLSIKNLDDRTIVFPHGGSQRGYRDNQYGFRAMYNYGKPVLDIGNPENFGGLIQVVELAPGKSFSAEVDLKKWFAFDQPGTYAIHGFYALAFYAPVKHLEGMLPSNILWTEDASADFTITVK